MTEDRDRKKRVKFTGQEIAIFFFQAIFMFAFFGFGVKADNAIKPFAGKSLPSAEALATYRKFEEYSLIALVLLAVAWLLGIFQGVLRWRASLDGAEKNSAALRLIAFALGCPVVSGLVILAFRLS